MLSKSKIKAQTSVKKLSTSRGSSAGLGTSGNLTLKLQKADQTITPFESTAPSNFLAQYINKSNASSKTSIERITISDEPQTNIANLIRKLQPSSTKNIRPPLTDRTSFNFLS